MDEFLQHPVPCGQLSFLSCAYAWEIVVVLTLLAVVFGIRRLMGIRDFE